jgi:HJR/Mrr/RecB family endonuclease
VSRTAIIAAWFLALGLVLKAAFDPSIRLVLQVVVGGALLLRLLVLVGRRRRLGRASPEELDVMSGAEFEDYVAERVRAAGWSTSAVLRRGDFGADLTAERAGVRVAVQAKRRAVNVGNRAVQEAVSGADFHGCEAAVVVTQARFTPAARRQAAAARLPVALVDREALANFPQVLADVAAEVAARRKA